MFNPNIHQTTNLAHWVMVGNNASYTWIKSGGSVELTVQVEISVMLFPLTINIKPEWGDEKKLCYRNEADFVSPNKEEKKRKWNPDTNDRWKSFVSEERVCLV